MLNEGRRMYATEPVSEWQRWWRIDNGKAFTSRSTFGIVSEIGCKFQCFHSARLVELFSASSRGLRSTLEAVEA